MFCFFFKKINKIDKPLARFTKKKREDPNKIRNERGEIATNTAEIQKIIREYYEPLHANELDNLEEMDKFLETHSPPKLNQEETDNLNRMITRSEMESVKKKKKKKLPANKREWLPGWLHWGILPNIQRRAYTNPSQTLPED